MKKRIVTYVVILQVIIIGAVALSIYKKEKQSSVSVYPVYKQDVMSSPSGELKYFYEPKQGALDTVDGKYIYYTINSDTLNDRYDYTPNKQNGVFRIITLGDSITFGLRVDTKYNWTELLEDKLNSEMKCSNINKFEVINLGVQGYDSAYAVERYKRRGIKYNPDLILWYQFDMLRWDEEQQKILSKYKTVLGASDSLDSQVRQQILFDLLQKAAQSVIDKFGENKMLSYQKNAIESLRNYYTGKLLIIAFPEMRDDFKRFLSNSFSNQKNTFLYLNSTDYLAKKYIVDDVHPNVQGHELIANNIFDYLKNSKLIPCD